MLHLGGLFSEDYCVGVEEADLDRLGRGRCCEADGAEEDGRGENGEGRSDDRRCVRKTSAAEIDSGGDGGGEQQQEEGDAPRAGERGDLQDGQKALLRVGEAAGGTVRGDEAGEIFDDGPEGWEGDDSAEDGAAMEKRAEEEDADGEE